jgi:homoserine dehydrogenase
MEEGITEPDPSLDVNGWDTGAKTVILANTLWDEAIGLEGVSVIGLDSLIEVDSEDWPVRLVGAAVRAGDEVHLEVAPKQIAQDHPLSGLQGRDKGVVFHGPHIGHVVVSGGRSHPSGAAASVLGDVLELSAVL